MLMALTANAQYPDRPQYPDQQRDYRYSHDRDHDRLFDRLRSDLDRASAGTLPFTGDKNRVNMARERVNDCQRMLASGNFDRRMFENTVASLRRVIDMNRLSDENRNLLRDDIGDLHRVAERMGGY